MEPRINKIAPVGTSGDTVQLLTCPYDTPYSQSLATGALPFVVNTGAASSPSAPECIPEPERSRLSAQCVKILTRLRSGDATNAELCALALNYRARISDLRRHGFGIKVKSRDRATGVTLYRLEAAC